MMVQLYTDTNLVPLRVIQAVSSRPNYMIHLPIQTKNVSLHAPLQAGNIVGPNTSGSAGEAIASQSRVLWNENAIMHVLGVQQRSAAETASSRTDPISVSLITQLWLKE